MIIENKIGYSYNDLTMVPDVISDISSRSECNPFDNERLPIFASPMSTITNEHNIDIWKRNRITPVLPRNLSFEFRFEKMCEGEWVALSLKEFKTTFIESNQEPNKTYNVCVDLANGHMKSLYKAINQAKNISREIGYTLVIMTGNIANPETYEWICKNAEVDYIRLSIGTGANCITTTQTSTHYPVASLIDECHKIKKGILPTTDRDLEHWNIKTPYHGSIYSYGMNHMFNSYKSRPMLVADGGIRGYADVIKALGLGADYVMVGSLFTKLLESAGPLNIECYNSHYQYHFKNDGTVDDGVNDLLNIWSEWDENEEAKRRSFIHDMKSLTKESYGMSTKKAQKLIDPSAKTKTSEGCTKIVDVKETVHQWTENMIAYLKSAMSYSNKWSLDDFKGNCKFIVNSPYAIASVNK